MLIVVALECVLQHLVCLSKASSVSPGGGKVSVGGGQALPVVELLVGCAPFQQLGDLQQHARCFTRCRNFSAVSEDQHPHSPIDWSSCQSRCCSTTDVQCSFEIGLACCGCLRIFGTISTTVALRLLAVGLRLMKQSIMFTTPPIWIYPCMGMRVLGMRVRGGAPGHRPP